MPEAKKIWITWERQRRSLELAKVLGCELYMFDFKGVLRYPQCICATLKVLISSPGRIIFVQNPSMVLAATACLFKLLAKRTIVVDRHSTFPLKKKKLTPARVVFILLNKFTIRIADLTIVSNAYLADVVEELGGKAYVLPDKLPDLVQTKKTDLKKGFNIFLISSFNKDEPIGEVIKAAENLKDQGVNFYVSGNTGKLEKSLFNRAPSNLVFTGFLTEEDFVNHIYSSDAVMALTTADHCMLCGCYEAVAAGKPLITSDKLVLREYFSGSVFVDNTSEGITNGVRNLILFYDDYLESAPALKSRIEKTWSEKYHGIEVVLRGLDSY